MVLLFLSCASIAGQQHDEIVYTAINLASSYVSKNMYEEALSVYDRAIKEAADFRLNYNKAIILSSLNRFEEAAQLCNESFAIYPYIISFKKAEAYYLSMSGNTNAQIDVLNEIINLNPYDIETRKQLIDLYLSIDNKNEALNNAVWLFEHGSADVDTVQILYSINPDEWSQLYNLLKN